VGELIAMSGRTFADRPAVVAGDVRLSYAEFADRVARLATALEDMGCTRGSRVALLSQNSLPVLELHFAVATVGATIVPLNTRFTGSELAGCLENAGAELIMVTGELAGRLPEQGPTVFVIDAIGPDGLTQYEALVAGSEPRASVEQNPPEVAAIFYTSGSTGRPKGVQLTHDSVLAGAMSCALAVGLDARSTWLHASPMFHLADAWAIWAATLLGACHVIERFEGSRTLQTLQREHVSHTILVPTSLEMLADAAVAAGGPGEAFSGLTSMLYGGAPLAEGTYRRMIDLGVPMFGTYGSTETSGCMSVLRPEQHVRADGSLRIGVVGLAVPMSDIRIVDDEGHEVPRGEVGEITVASPNLMLGYNKAPDLTADAIRGGRYHTGDLGRVDEDGYVTLAGRKKEMLISGGENVYPNEVELALREHPSIRDVGVGGLPDARWGQRIAAVIVPVEGETVELEECQAFLAGQLAGYKIPKAAFTAGELPRNASGKIDRAALQSLLLELDGGASASVASAAL
jgi:long-chain acyl-CoA synthetase